jgi:adenylate cyclase
VDVLTAAELARRAAVPPERVEQLTELGILTPASDGYRATDVQRIRLVDAFEGAGVAAEELARAVAAGLRSLEGFDLAHPEPPSSSGRTLAAVCAELGHDVEVAEATFAALALPVPDRDAELREDDAGALAALLDLCDLRPLGLDENVAPRIARIYGEGARRATEAAVRFWDEHVETRLNETDPSGTLNALRARTRARLSPELETTLLWLHRRHMEHETYSIIVENTERALERSGLRAPRAALPAIAFLDISGFTGLTEEQGDEAAVALVGALEELVEEVVRRHRGKIVKRLGDGVMLHFADPTLALAAARDLVDGAPGAGLPPARVGIDAGRVVFRDGDYYGRTVNVAARITEYAGPGDVLVGETVAMALPDGAQLEELGPVALKGLREPVALYSAI